MDNILESKIDAQKAEIVSLRATLPVKDTYTIADIARKLGVAQSTLYQKCWNLPNFGKPNIGYNPRRWLRATVDAWFSTPEADRREAWESMSEEQKRKALT
ncbi:MAG: hypothetical protein ABFC92_02765 [Rectinema sp.]